MGVGVVVWDKMQTRPGPGGSAGQPGGGDDDGVVDGGDTAVILMRILLQFLSVSLILIEVIRF